MLALLLIHRNEVLAADRIVDALWGEDAPSGALKALRVTVAGLRRVLEPDRPARSPPHVLVTKQTGYVLCVPDSDLDAMEYEQLVVRAESDVATDPQGAADRLDAASKLWRGRPYEDVAYEDFAHPEIRRLDELHLRATEVAIEVELRLGRHHDVIGRIEALVCDHPLHEPFWSQLMIALYRSGRQPDALRAYRRACDALAEIGTTPSADLGNLERQILFRDLQLDVTVAVPGLTGNLPAALSSFVGRGVETAHVRELVGRHRLVTLSGPGGVGKSRLAVEAARGVAGAFPHGVWMVELAGVDDGDEVAAAVGAVLETPGGAEHADVVDGLVEHLAGRTVLLLLDNCEHLTDAVAGLIYTLLTRCRRLRILATSRRPLGVEGEIVAPIEPMHLDDGPDGEPGEAVRLFLDRAAPISPAVTEMPGARSLATRVCRRGAGLPLAIELAAARLRIMSLEELARRCEDDAAVLSGGPTYPIAHHAAMRATLDWSYRLLDPAEQTLLRRLSVFRGGFTLAIATRFHAGFPEAKGDVVQLIGGLVDASMMASGSNRLTLLEPVRRYAQSVLDTHGEAPAAQRAHAAVFLEMFRVPDSVLFYPGDWVPGMLQRFEPEIDNVSAALAWAFASGEIAAAVELTSVAGPLLMMTRPLREAQRWFERGLAATSDPTPARARILAHACINTAHLEGVDATEPLVDALSTTAEMLDDDRWRAAAALRRADLAAFRDDFASAETLYEESVTRFEILDHADVCVALNNYTDGLGTAGRFDDADRVARRLAEAAERHDRRATVALARVHRAYFAVCRGDAAAAHRFLAAAASRVGPSAGYAELVRCLLALLEDDIGAAEETAWSVLAASREIGHVQQLCDSLRVVGLVQLAKGDAGAAHLFLAEALRTANRPQHGWLRRDLLAPLAATWAELDPARGAALLAAVEEHNRRTDCALPLPVARIVARATRSLPDELDPDQLEAARRRGAALTFDEAILLAMEGAEGHYTGAGIRP